MKWEAVIIFASIVTAAYVYPDYCTKVVNDSLVSKRRVPPLTPETVALKPQIVQVNAMIRHGARTPVGGAKCWDGYQPHWYCSVSEVIQGVESAGAVDSYGQQPRSFSEVDKSPDDARGARSVRIFKRRQLAPEAEQSLEFLKRYDADVDSNVFGGTCQKGQLISEGYKQHALIGKYLSDAYLASESEHRIPYASAPALISKKTIGEEMYIRSTDMQRTLLSGMSLVTTMLQEAGFSPNRDALTIHTIDLENEYLYPNLASCPAISRIKREFATSPEFEALVAKYQPLKQRLAAATGLPDIRSIWPGGIFDCLMTTICTEQWNTLPAGLQPSVKYIVKMDDGQTQTRSLLNLTLDVISELAAEEFLFQKSAYARSAAASLVVEWKTNVLQGWQATTGTSLLEKLGLDAETATDFKNHMAEALNDSKRGSSKFVLYSAHDTSIMMLLAALGEDVFDRQWPPYASVVLFEVFKIPTTSQDGFDAFFRLIYNHKNLTPKIPGCVQRDVCEVATFFKWTQWATPTAAKAGCQSA